jgi:hypothetical protein
MKIEAAKVTDFYIEPGRGTHFRALLEVRLEGAVKDQILWVELTDKEISAVRRLARQVEQRLLAGPANLPYLKPARSGA